MRRVRGAMAHRTTKRTRSTSEERRYWLAMLKDLRAFKARHGHCRVRARFPDHPGLGKWVIKQRVQYRRGTLAATRRRILDNLGFVWRDRRSTASDAVWERKYAALAEFKRRHGHCLPIVPGLRQPRILRPWVGRQRTLYRQGRLDPERRQRLERLGFVWDAFEVAWQTMFRRLVAFKRRHGDFVVPTKRYHAVPKLATWTVNQRIAKRRGRLAPHRVRQLEEVGFPWEVRFNPAPEDRVAELRAFRRRYGHLAVPKNPAYSALAQWLKHKQGLWTSGALDSRLERALVGVGVPLDPNEIEWEEWFARLKAHRDRTGHLNVKPGTALARWMGAQREALRRGELDLACERRLASLGLALA